MNTRTTRCVADLLHTMQSDARTSRTQFTATTLLLVTSFVIGLSVADITGTDPQNSACLCLTSSSVYLRDSACGNVLDIADTGDCFRYSGGKMTCIDGTDTHQFFRVDYKNASAWVVGSFVEVGSDSSCDAAPSELKAIVLGDWGEILLPGQDQVAYGMAVWANTSRPKWIITTGDNIYPSGIDSWDDPQMDFKWRNIYDQESIKDLPWYVSLGNHDYGDWLGEEWNMVELGKHDPQWILPHLWYDFTEILDDHTVHFIVFDTETYRNLINNYTDMLVWFERTLEESQADWKLVIGHRHVFTVGDLEPVTGQLFDYLVPLMEQYKVDAYVCGHDHNVQHLKNLTGSGVDYVLSGAGGALLMRYLPANELTLRQEYGVESLYFEMTYGFVTLTTRRQQLIFDYFDQDANLLYTFARPRQQN